MKYILLLTLFISFCSIAGVKVLKSDLKFKATGKPSFIKATGSIPFKETNFEYTESELSGSAKVDLTKLDSGIELRDTHLKEKYLHTNKFPEAQLVILKQKAPVGKTSKLTAQLTFHGVKKEIMIDAELEKKGKVITLVSSFDFMLTDYGVELPSFQGITAADKVKLNVVTSFEL